MDGVVLVSCMCVCVCVSRLGLTLLWRTNLKVGLAWTDLSPEDVEGYFATQDVEEKLKYVDSHFCRCFLGRVCQ